MTTCAICAGEAVDEHDGESLCWTHLTRARRGTPDDWTDADATTLPTNWRDEDPDGPCARCGTDTEGDFCEKCDAVIRLRQARR